MLSYNKQYQILAGIHYAFTNETKERILHVSHSVQKQEKMKPFLSSTKYESKTTQNFIIIALYSSFTNNFTSLHDLFVHVSSYTDQDIKRIMRWKSKIQNYNLYLSKDITYLQDNYGGLPDYQTLIGDYRKGNIRWFTMYYALVYSDANLENMKKSRRFGKMLRKIEVLTLYITFNENTLQNMEKYIGSLKETL